jgi:hypothetical protein
MAAAANAAATHIRVDCMIVPFESLNDIENQIDPARGGAPYERQLNTFAGEIHQASAARRPLDDNQIT